jgi:DNA polymerase III epsilon subunit-like protein
MKDVMIDIETMGTRSTSMIVQIGACYFNRVTGEIGDTFKVHIYHSNDDFTVDWSTIKWWLEREEIARQSIISDELEVRTAVTRLKVFLTNAVYVWSHATFDIPILLNTFDKVGEKFPIHYTKMRDIRTLIDIKNDNKKSTLDRKGTHHDALDDCKFQVAYCVEALNK